MSTHIDPIPNSPPADKTSTRLTFPSLIEILQDQQAPPSLEQLFSWLENLDISAAELQPYIGFKDGNYWRHRVCRNDHVEMLVLCWRPGHRTPIHDHNGSHGAVLVQEGILWETTFTFDPEKGLCYKAAREYGANEVTGAEVPDIHQLGNPEVSGRGLITLHIYAPPLGVLKTYKVGSPEIDLYIPDESEV